MSDIICARCHEGWDSTGGIQYTHSDLNEEQYTLLLEGRGCPCCCGDFNKAGFEEPVLEEEQPAIKAAFVEAWQKSIEHLSEGEADWMYHTFDVRPKEPVEAERYDSAW